MRMVTFATVKWQTLHHSHSPLTFSLENRQKKLQNFLVNLLTMKWQTLQHSRTPLTFSLENRTKKLQNLMPNGEFAYSEVTDSVAFSDLKLLRSDASTG
jgi:hypothetical protein